MQPDASFLVTAAYRGMRLDRFLQQMLPKMSRTSVQDAIDERVTLASGAPAKASRRLAVGDQVCIGARVGSAPVVALDVPTLARGAGWLVVDKPAGLASTPSARRPGADLATRLGVAPAHRLDRFTSGCLLATDDAAAARWFDRAFREGLVDKEYVAVVEGVPRDDAFVVDAPLGVATWSRVDGKVGVAPDGVPAITRFEVLARQGDRALVRAMPLTGRRHQIRVHLAHCGHPIVGDVLYGPDERQFIRLQRGQPVAAPPGLAPGRHLLHARRLVFPEPGTNERREVCAPWPADFGIAPADCAAT